jgi:hypothetical protein
MRQQFNSILYFDYRILNIAKRSVLPYGSVLKNPQVFPLVADKFPGMGDSKKRRATMETQDFLRVINELDFILDDIDEISGQLDLTKAENNKMYQAISSIEKTKKILVELFPSIKSLDYDVREDLTAELMES